MDQIDALRPALESVLAWIVAWLPWFMLMFAVFCVVTGIVAPGGDLDVARNLLLVAIAVTLLMMGFVGLVMVQ